MPDFNQSTTRGETVSRKRMVDGAPSGLDGSETTPGKSGGSRSAPGTSDKSLDGTEWTAPPKSPLSKRERGQ